jgi:hypothetical protein
MLATLTLSAPAGRLSLLPDRLPACDPESAASLSAERPGVFGSPWVHIEQASPEPHSSQPRSLTAHNPQGHSASEPSSRASPSAEATERHARKRSTTIA